MSGWRRWWPAVFLAIVPLLPLGRTILRGEAIGPFDQIGQMAPWNGDAALQPWDVLQADGVLQTYAWRDLVFEAWGKGQLPLWNPYQLGGTPLLANSQSAGFYPPHILLGILHVPTAWAIGWLAWFHLFWAGLGLYAFCRKLGASPFGSALAGASFSLSAFMLAWVALASVVSTVAWIPWVIAGVVALFESADGRSALRRVFPLAFPVAMMLLAGHLQFAAYGLMAACVVAVWMAVAALVGKQPVGARLAAAVAALALGLMLAAPQLLPVLDYGKRSHRSNVPTEEGYQANISGAIQPFEWATVPAANLLGLPQRWSVRESERSSSYWPQYAKRGGNFAESACALGPLVVALIAAVAWRRRWAAMLAAMGAVGMALAVGSPLDRWLYFGVPGWSASGSPGRAVVLFVLAACALAGLGVDNLPLLRRPGQWLVLGLPLILLTLAMGWGGSVSADLAPWMSGLVDDKWLAGLKAGAVLQAAYPALAAACLTVMALFVLAKAPRWRGLCLLAPAVVMAATLGLDMVRSGDTRFLKGSSPSPTRFAFVNDRWELFAAAHALAPPNTAASMRMHDLAGYDSLLDRDTVALLRAIDGADPAPPANGNLMFVKSTADPSTLADAGVSEVWSLKPLPRFGQPFSEDRGVLRYRLAGKGRAYSDRGPAEIVEDGPDREVVRALGPGRLVVKDRNMGLWSAEIDGHPADLRGEPWRELDLPPGKHTVVFRYKLDLVAKGLLLAVLAVLVLAGIQVGQRLKTEVK